MELITQNQWIDLPHHWKVQLTMDVLNGLIPIINKNHQTNFKLFELYEYPIAVLDYWNYIIDCLNKIHDCTINHLDMASSFHRTFDTLNCMIELENNFEEKNKVDYVSNIRKVLAIEMLEYEDKNYLSGDNKTRSEEKQKLLKEVLDYLGQKACTASDKNN